MPFQAPFERPMDGECGYPNWRGRYDLDYERDEDGRISRVTLSLPGPLFTDVIEITPTPDGRLYIGDVQD